MSFQVEEKEVEVEYGDGTDADTNQLEVEADNMIHEGKKVVEKKKKNLMNKNIETQMIKDINKELDDEFERLQREIKEAEIKEAEESDPSAAVGDSNELNQGMTPSEDS